MTDDYRTARLARGTADVWKTDDGTWAVTWRPNKGEPDYPGHTYLPRDLGIPDDFPTPDTLLAWAREHWDGSHPPSGT